MPQLSDFIEGQEYTECIIECGRSTCNNYFERKYDSDYHDAVKEHERDAIVLGWTLTRHGVRCPEHSKRILVSNKKKKETKNANRSKA